MANFIVDIKVKSEELKRAMAYMEEKKRELSNFDGDMAGFNKLNKEYQGAVESVTKLATTIYDLQSKAVNPTSKAITEMAKGIDIDMGNIDVSMRSSVEVFKTLGDLARKNKDVFLGLSNTRLDEIFSNADTASSDMINLMSAVKGVNTETLTLLENARGGLSSLPAEMSMAIKERIDESVESLKEQNEKIDGSIKEIQQTRDNIQQFTVSQLDMSNNGGAERLKEEQEILESRISTIERLKAAEEERMRTIESQTGQTPEVLRETNAEYSSAANNAQIYANNLAELRGEISKTEVAQKQQGEQTKVTAQEIGTFNSFIKQGGEAYEYLNKLDDKTYLQGLIDQLEVAKQKLVESREEAQRLTENYNKMARSVNDGNKGGYTQQQIDTASGKANSAQVKYADAVDGYNMILEKINQTKAALGEQEQRHVSIRTQIRQAREEMIALADSVGTVSPKFQQAAIQAGLLQRKMALANATMRYYANPIRHLAALKTGLQGVAGAAGLVTGVMGLFNSNSEKTAEIQKKVQSVLAVIVGLETTYNLIKKSSTFILAIQEIKTWATAKAMQAEAAATAEAAVAQEGLNVAMAANPIGAVVTVVVTAVAAIWALCSALSSTSEESSILKEREEALQKAENEQAGTVAKSETAYRMLVKAYNDSGQSLEKMKEKYPEYVGWMKDAKIKTLDEVSAKRMLLKTLQPMLEMYKAESLAIAAQNAAINEQQEMYKNLSEIRKKLASGETITDKDLKKVGAAWGWNEDRFNKYAKEVNKYLTTENGVDDFFAAMFSPEDVDLRQRDGTKVDDTMKVLYRAGDEMVKSVTEPLYKEALAASLRAKELAKEIEAETGATLTNNSNDSDNKVTTKRDVSSTTIKQIEREEEEEYSVRLANSEKRRKQMISDAQKEEELKIKLMRDGAEKTLRQRKFENKKELDAIRELARQRQLDIIASEKSEFDKKEDEKAENDKKYLKRNYYNSEQYKSHYKGGDDSKADNLLLDKEVQSYQDLMIKLKSAEQSMLADKELQNSLKEFEQYYSKRLQIERKYDVERRKLEENAKLAGISESDKASALKAIDEQENAEKSKLAFEDFKESPLYQMAMMGNNSAIIDPTALETVKREMEEKMREAASQSPADFKAFADAYVSITDKLIEQDPFKALKDSAKELKLAEDEAKASLKELEEIKGKYLDENGNISKVMVDGQLVDNTLEQDNERVIQMEKQFEEAKKNGSLTTEELTKKESELAEARKKRNTMSLAVSKAEQEISNATNKTNNAIVKANNASDKNVKATKKVIQVTKQWADALKSAAGLFHSPIADAVVGMADLASTTLDSIEAIKLASNSSAKGIEKVANAVAKAVAILAIIQAAWKVIETIMSIFDSAEEKRYQAKIDALQAKIQVLDYTFNNLKSDMDEMWGTEAIDKYISALDTLDAKSQATMDKIKVQASRSKKGFFGVGGYHSLSYKQSRQVSDAQWRQAYKVMQDMGFFVSGSGLDWLYNMSPEQLSKFMATGIGQTIMTLLSSVNSNEYSGSQWLSDMQNYADMFNEKSDLIKSGAEKLNGISLDGLKEEFQSLVTSTELSLNTINNSFDQFMRNATWNRIRGKYEKEMDAYYERLTKLNEDYTEGKITEAEYRRKLAEYREEYKKDIQKANDEYKSSLDDAGVNLKDVEQGGTSGGFESMSEDTGTELNGRFAAMQAQMTYIADNTTEMKSIMTSGISIADEIRTIQVNSYLELQAIQENTLKVVAPIQEMREILKKVKENTDKL